MRVEDFKHQKEVFQRPVPFQPFRSFPKDLRGEIIFFQAKVGGIPFISRIRFGSQGMPCHSFGIGRIFHRYGRIRNPQIIFLSANIFRTGEIEKVITGPALPHMIMITDDHTGMPVPSQYLRNIYIFRFQRTPSAPRKLEAACPDISSGGHAGIGTDI